MQITITLNKDSEHIEVVTAIHMLQAFINDFSAGQNLSESAQPAVASNTGNSGSGLPLSPEATVVVGESVTVAETEPKDSPTPVKERKPRAKKEEPAPVTEEAAVSTSESADAANVPVASFTIDDVRATLQSYTAANGVSKGVALLEEFGAKRISELKAEDYAAFVEKCGA
jgi:hypothetical protein